MILRNSNVYLLSCDQKMSQRITVSTILKLPILERVSGIENFLFIPQLPDAVIIVSSAPTAVLAENLRGTFPDGIFLLTLITDVDGFLPQAAWDFIRTHTGLLPVR